MPTSRDIRRLRELWLWLLLSFTSCHFSKVILASVCVWNAMMIPVTPPELHQWNTCMHNTHTHMHTRSPNRAFSLLNICSRAQLNMCPLGPPCLPLLFAFRAKNMTVPQSPAKKGLGSPLGHLTPLQFCCSLQLFNPFILLLDGKLCGAAYASCSITFRLFSIIGYSKILNVVPCAIQSVLVAYLFYI